MSQMRNARDMTCDDRKQAGLSLGNASIRSHLARGAVPRAAALGAAVASAQALERDQTAHVRFLALNVAIGATASVARAVASGTPVRVALAKGLLGGSLMSAGMELIGTESRADAVRGTSAHRGRRERGAQRRRAVPRCSPTSRCRSTRCTCACGPGARPGHGAPVGDERSATRVGDDRWVAPTRRLARDARDRRAGASLAKVAPSVSELSAAVRRIVRAA